MPWQEAANNENNASCVRYLGNNDKKSSDMQEKKYLKWYAKYEGFICWNCGAVIHDAMIMAAHAAPAKINSAGIFFSGTVSAAAVIEECTARWRAASSAALVFFFFAIIFQELQYWHGAQLLPRRCPVQLQVCGP